MATPKTSPLLAELRSFAANLGEVPYDKLLAAAAEAGWQYRLVQRDAVLAPAGGSLVTFDVLVGRDGVLEPFDTVSIGVPAGNPQLFYPTSMAARSQMGPTLIHLFFDRLPPPPRQPEPEAIHVDAGADDGDIVLPGETPPVAEPMRLDVVARREPDGVPIFKDLYTLSSPTTDTIEAVLDEIDDFLQRASTVEQIDAMGLKNEGVISFFRDLGQPADIDEFRKLVNERRTALAPPKLANTPRRRGTTTARNMN